MCSFVYVYKICNCLLHRPISYSYVVISTSLAPEEQAGRHSFLLFLGHVRTLDPLLWHAPVYEQVDDGLYLLPLHHDLRFRRPPLQRIHYTSPGA